MREHDVEPGPLTRCQLTGSEDLHLILDLGSQPPCDALLSSAQLAEPEVSYPLALNLCPASGLAQLSYVVDGAEIYPPSYPYRSGISKPLADYQRVFADRVLARFRGTKPNPLVVDVGSNDGTLLTGFKQQGCRVLGVEPTDVAEIARMENGIETVQRFFDEECAREIAERCGRAAIITMTNVFAHMATLGSVMRGLDRLLADDGVFITESHYLLDVFEKLQFDTIYHEHIRTYSLRSLVVLAAQYGFEVFDVERGDRYGGNIRAYFARHQRKHVEESVGQLLQAEEAAGLFRPAAWEEWARRVRTQRNELMTFLWDVRARSNAVIAGCSAPGRACTLINWYGIGPDLVPYTGELHNSLKLGKFLPGSHIPVVENTRLVAEQPDYVLLFSWHYADVIAARLRAEGVRARLLKPLPKFEVIS